MHYTSGTCKYCGDPTTNPKFCSRSCSVAFYNKLNPRRVKTKKCAGCGDLVLSSRKYCSICKNELYCDFSQITIGDLKGRAKYQKSAAIRNHARRVFHAAHPDAVCSQCGYDKHIEVCHIQAIDMFPNDTPVAVVNSLDNLVGLCPNHHWEFDNGILTI